MGLETRSTARKGKSEFEGKLYLDSEYLQFKSKELPWKIKLGKGITAKKLKGQLQVSDGNSTLSFDVGDDADRWIKKILNPPALMTKLGVKGEHKCFVSAGFSKEFKEELKIASAGITRSLEKAGLIFHFVPDSSKIDQLVDLLGDVPDGVNIWVVWPKSSPKVSQGEIMDCAKKFGFGPSKTASFSAEASSMRFARKKK